MPKRVQRSAKSKARNKRLTAAGSATSSRSGQSASAKPPRRVTRVGARIRNIPVGRIRPEEGLGRKRDREGHQELCHSIAQFGVLTPITVRAAPDGSADYLLIKGQGRTLACLMLGLKTIPAIVVADQFADTAKVQQFLVENVARLRMRPIDRALLIAHARKEGEETASVAKRFGVSAATVRRLEAQLDGATSGEVAALRSGQVSLALHSVISRYVQPEERAEVLRIVLAFGIRATEMQALLLAFDWRTLSKLGDGHRTDRVDLITWALSTLASLPRGEVGERIRHLAIRMPVTLTGSSYKRDVI